jgi:hypothetical protein
MKRPSAVVVLGLAFVALACHRNPAPGEQGKQPPPGSSYTDADAAAKRVSAYLSSAVVTPKLRDCWGRVKGEGLVGLEVVYRKAGATWTFDKARATASTLAKGQDEVLRGCLEEAARGTTFPVEAGEAIENMANVYYLNLAMPVPLPPEGGNVPEPQMARMIATGGGNGEVTVPGCSECVSRKEYPYGLKCESRSKGGHMNCEEISSNVCATDSTTCLRGAWGGLGGVVMF